MNASISPEVLGRIAVQSINDRLSMRAELLFGMRERLKCFMRTNGRMDAKELQDFVCCLRECIGSDLKEAKASLLDLSIDLDGIIYYPEQNND